MKILAFSFLICSDGVGICVHPLVWSLIPAHGAAV